MVAVALGRAVGVGTKVRVDTLVMVGETGDGVEQAESSKRENKMMESVRFMAASPSL
jgi:hypothetical protein